MGITLKQSHMYKPMNYLNIVGNNIISFNIGMFVMFNTENINNVFFIVLIRYININENKNFISQIRFNMNGNKDFINHLYSTITGPPTKETDNFFKKFHKEQFDNVKLFKSSYYIHEYLENINIIVEENIMVEEKKNILINYFNENSNKEKEINSVLSYLDINIKTIKNINENDGCILTEEYYTFNYDGYELVKMYIFSRIKSNTNKSTYNCELFSHVVNINYDNIRRIKLRMSISESINNYLDNLLKKYIIINKNLIETDYLSYDTNFNNFNNISRTISNIKRWISINNNSPENSNTLVSSNQYNQQINNKFSSMLKKYKIKSNSDFLLININDDNIYNYKEKDIASIIIKILIEEPKIIVVCSQIIKKEKVTLSHNSKKIFGFKKIKESVKGLDIFKKIMKKTKTYSNSSSSNSSNSNSNFSSKYFNNYLNKNLEYIGYNIFPDQGFIDNSNGLKITIYTKKINIDNLLIFSQFYKKYIYTSIQFKDNNENNLQKIVIFNFSNKCCSNDFEKILETKIRSKIITGGSNIFLCGDLKKISNTIQCSGENTENNLFNENIHTELVKRQKEKFTLSNFTNMSPEEVEQLEMNSIRSKQNNIFNKFLNNIESVSYIYYRYLKNNNKINENKNKLNIKTNSSYTKLVETKTENDINDLTIELLSFVI
jgi:hypothetical protein